MSRLLDSFSFDRILLYSWWFVVLPLSMDLVDNNSWYFLPQLVRLNSPRGWCGSAVEPGSNWLQIDLRAPSIIRGFRTQGVIRGSGSAAFTSAVRIQTANNLTGKEYFHLTRITGNYIVNRRTMLYFNRDIFNSQTKVHTTKLSQKLELKTCIYVQNILIFLPHCSTYDIITL